MPGIDQIVAATRQKVTEVKRTANQRELERRAESHVPRGFRHSLEFHSQRGPAIIAELKKASPSRGLIRRDFNAPMLARQFEQAGAAALSVLTDQEFFQGSLENLRLASSATKLPCLRKDFIVDEFQLLEARANAADAILLIAAALPAVDLKELACRAGAYGLDVLCEVHDQEELKQAIDVGCSLIGVNSRDLRSFEVDLETAFRLAELIPDTAVRVAESGIENREDIGRLRSAGYHAFLIGESLMKAQFPGAALRGLLARA
jgi:indole-3-glycerol phosphate synthase